MAEHRTMVISITSIPFCSSCSSHRKSSSTVPNRHVGQGRLPPPELERVLWNGSALPLSNVIMHAVSVTKATITSQGCDAQNSPCARNNRPTLIFTHFTLSNLRFFDFVVVFFLFVGFKSGTIRNALAAATSAHTDHRAHAVALKWEGEKGPLGIAPHQQAHAEQASTSSPQHCSGDTENEDARAAAATVVVAPKICCCCCCSGLTSGTVPPQHLGTITFPTSGGSDFDACVSARGLSLWEGRKEKEAALV